MKEIKSIDVVQAGKVMGLIGAVMGLVAALLVIVFTSIGGLLAYGPFFPRNLTFVAIITFPLMYGISGFIGTVIFAAIYNWIAKKIGGLKLDL